MEPEAERALLPELGAGERLLWVGRPGAGLTSSDLFAILFGTVWTGTWILIFMRPGDQPPPPLLFVAAMVAFGLVMTFGRFLVGAYLQRKTYYGVSNERIVIKREIFRRRVRSLNLRTLVEVTLTERRNGIGTISFGGAHWDWRGSGADFWAPGTYHLNAFERVPAAREVYEQIRAAQRAAP
jgi:hypothetical protein